MATMLRRTRSHPILAALRLRRGLCSAPVPGVKGFEVFSEEFELGGRWIKLETGFLARLTNASVELSATGTSLLVAVACGGRADGVQRDFLPLTVEYQENKFAQGKIPATYMRREGAPTERELLCGRLVDRPIRPLFPNGFYHEVQITVDVLASDRKHDPDVMGATATSAALMLSDIPWGGPIGMIRLGRVDGRFVINPSMDELGLSDLNLVYACTQDKTMMIDVQAHGISEKDLEAGLRLAHLEAIKCIGPQIRLAEKAGKKKKEYKLSMITERTMEKVERLTAEPIEAVFTDPKYGKFERGEALDKITQDAKAKLEEECDEESLKVLPKVVDGVRKKIVRKRVLEKGLRVDGRGLDEVRPIFCKSHHLPELHGSSVFSRGDTQVCCLVTLGTPADAQRLDYLVGPSSKRFMLHYSFPSYSINEAGKRVGLNRREVGHGTLAEKALLTVLPPEEDFPYTIRVNSKVMASDGSTSMATVCGGSMALMDAGVPVREHVAAVSVGLISEVDPSSGSVIDYRILTDILGLEDHIGDMDFKIAGTRTGVTAIQLDIKPAGIPLDIICESLYHARKGRMPILDRMEQEISNPRSTDESGPKLATLKYSNDSIWHLLGGFRVKKIEEETGARISLSDGTITIVARDQKVMDIAQEKVDFIVGRKIEVGGVYKGIVTSIKEYGAFVEFNGGQQGLLHISELSHKQVSKISDVVSVGDEISMMCIGQDVRGNIKLSLKAMQPQPGPQIHEVGKAISTKQASDVCSSVESDNGPDKMDFASYGSTEIIIRSATECEDAEITRKQHAFETKSHEEQFTGHSSVGEVTRSGTSGERNVKTESKASKPGQSAMSAKLRDIPNKTESASGTAIHPKQLKLGDELLATVYQIRAHGLVLDLGGGFRGMYKFEENGKKDFSVGMKVQVRCSSFSSKGIPTMTLVEE